MIAYNYTTAIIFVTTDELGLVENTLRNITGYTHYVYRNIPVKVRGKEYICNAFLIHRAVLDLLQQQRPSAIRIDSEE